MLIKIDASNLNELRKRMNCCLKDTSDINAAIKSRKQNMPMFICSEYSIGSQLTAASKDIVSIEDQIRHVNRVLGQLISDAEILLGNETKAPSSDKEKERKPGFWEGVWNWGSGVVTGVGQFIGGAVSYGADIIQGAGEFGYQALNEVGDALSSAGDWAYDILSDVFDGAGKLLDIQSNAVYNFFDYWVINISEHFDEAGLVLSSAISAGEAQYKLARGDLAGFFDSSAKVGFRFTAVFFSGKEREEMLSKGGEDLFEMYFGDTGAAFYRLLDDLPTPEEIIFSGTVFDDKIAKVLFGAGDYFADGDIKSLIKDVSEVVYSPSKEIFEYLDGIDDQLKDLIDNARIK